MKKLSKYMKYMVFALVLCVVTTVNVFASCDGINTACKECEYSLTYESKTANVILRAIDKGDGTIEIDRTNIINNGFVLSEFNVYGSSFKPTSGNRLYCPALYYDVHLKVYNGQTTKMVNVSTNKNNGYKVLTKVNESDNGLDLSQITQNTISCGFKADLYNIQKKKVEKQVTFTFDIIDNKLPSRDSTGTYMLYFDGVSASDFINNNTCNYNAYVVCETGKGDSNMPNSNAINYGAQCTFSKEEKIFTTDTEIENPDNLDNIGFGDDVKECEDVIGEILDEAQQLFDWMKILAPILVILFGTLDFAKATIAMDDKGMQAAMKKFPRRLIAAVALFFLPFLINLVLSLPGLGIENAVCGIGKVVIKI